MKATPIHWLLFLLVAWICCLSATRLHAQQDSLAQYFDDGGLSNRKNLVSVNLFAPIVGELSFRYERALNKRLSLEVGIQPKLPYWPPLEVGTPYMNEAVSGVGISAALHFFLWPKSPELHYIGPRYRFSTGQSARGANVTEHTLLLAFGYNLFVSKHLMFCYTIGLGAEFSRIQYGTYIEKSGFLAYQLAPGFGFIF